MSKAKKFEILAAWQFFALAIIFFLPLFFMSKNGFLGPDAGGYIAHGLSRPPLYPIFLILFKMFGSFQFLLARIVQTLLIFLSLLYATYWLQKKLHIKRIFAFLAIFVIGILMVRCKTTVEIMSEGIAFPIFVVTFLKYVDCFINCSFKNIFMVSCGSILLILTRQQFYFMYILMFIPLIIHRSEQTKTILFRFVITVLFLILVGMSFAKFYYTFLANTTLYNQTNGTQWQFSGWRILEQPIFLSSKKDVLLLHSSDERKIFLAIHDRLTQLKFTKNSMPSQISDNLLDSEFYYMTVLGKMQDSIRSAMSTSIPEKYSGTQMDNAVRNIAFTLFLNHIRENLSFYLLRTCFYIANPYVMIALSILIMTIIFCLISRRFKFFSTKKIFLFTGLLIIFANGGLVGLVETWSPRYFYYSYFIYFCMAAIISDYFFNDGDTEKTIREYKC